MGALLTHPGIVPAFNAVLAFGCALTALAAPYIAWRKWA